MVSRSEPTVDHTDHAHELPIVGIEAGQVGPARSGFLTGWEG
jgi:hypothetical protein